MAMAEEGDVTSLLREVHAGSPGAAERLMARVYDELKAIARSRSKGRGSLEPTTLVNEAYVKLFGRQGTVFENRKHFFWAAAQAMRDILIDDARRARAMKRGGGRPTLQFVDHWGPETRAEPLDLLALDDAINKLERVHPKAARVVVLRFFAGLSREETAAELGLSEAAVWREWSFAKVWLLTEIDGHSSSGES